MKINASRHQPHIRISPQPFGLSEDVRTKSFLEASLVDKRFHITNFFLFFFDKNVFTNFYGQNCKGLNSHFWTNLAQIAGFLNF